MECKEMTEIIIDPEFRSMIPPLSKEERGQLENNLRNEQNTETIVLLTWNGILIDGHNRYEICTWLGIPFKTMEKDFEDRDAVKEWIINNQLGRRNIGAYMRAELALKLEGLIAKKAKANLSSGGGDKKSDEYKKSPLTKSANPIIPINTRKELAKKADVSEDTIVKVKYIKEHAFATEKEGLQKQEKSINEVYKHIKNRLDRKSAAETAEKEEEAQKPNLLEEKRQEEQRYGKPVPGVDIPAICPIGKEICVQAHSLCDFWYAGGCNQDFDSSCKSGACNMPSAQKPNVRCPYCKHPLTIDYNRWKVLSKSEERC
jgi:hypothetical protein